MNVSYLAIFNSKPILERAYMGSTSGRLKYAVKKNLRKFESHFEDTLEWLKADAMDNGWKIEGTLPLTDADFRTRFEEYLNTNHADIEPFYIHEADLQYVDVITGEEEITIGWLVKQEE
jgi:hypothetical protein